MTDDIRKWKDKIIDMIDEYESYRIQNVNEGCIDAACCNSSYKSGLEMALKLFPTMEGVDD